MYDNNNVINIIYLIDITFSMKKYSNLINSISKINKKLLINFRNIKIGYVFYKDFKTSKYNINNEDSYDHIKIYPLSSKNIYIPKDIEFSGGYDYSEDWANPINSISKIIDENDNENIVIHLCDSNAHGPRFSDYDNDINDINIKEENLLIESLKQCKIKNIKFIGIILNNFPRKSFLECQKIYRNISGYYDLLDLTNNNEDFINCIIEKISNCLDNKNFINETYNNETNIIDESNFIFKDLLIIMKPLYEIEKYKGKKFKFLPDIKINNLEDFGIEQGFIGDCYLISSILSMISKFPLIFNYIFPDFNNYNERTEKIDMFIYEKGIKKLISFNNTYATYNGQLLFSKPYNYVFCGICLEKGYASSKCDNNKIKSGYLNINKGGFGYYAFESILGAKCECYISNDINSNIIRIGYKYINREKLKYKIKKYIDLEGLITFGIYYEFGGGHSYSLQGYKIDKNGELLIEIINPHRKGHYSTENIIFSKDKDTDNKKKLENIKKNNLNKKPIIDENDFKNNECKQSLSNYENNGYLIMEFDTFFKWYGTIEMCDPMFGCYEQIIEFIPNGEKNHIFNFIVKNKTKFKAYIFIEEKLNNIEKYRIKLRYKKGNIIYNDQIENNNKLIYEVLEPGFYTIEISINNSLFDMEIKDIIYLKIQSYDDLEIKTIIDNGIIKLGYNCFEIYEHMKFIKEFIYEFSKIIKDKNIGLFNELFKIMPREKNINNPLNNISNIQNIININNFFIDYHNTMDGFFVEIILKDEWKPFFIAEYRHSNNIYNIYTPYGNGRTSKDGHLKDFNKILEKIKNPESEIKKRDEKIAPKNPSSSPKLLNIIRGLIDNDNINLINDKKNNRNNNSKILPNNNYIHKVVDIIYLVDSTGSMGEQVKLVSNLVIEYSNQLNKNYPNIDFQFGIIFYNDPIDCPSDFNDFFQLTKNVNDIKNFCNNWKT